MSWRFPKFPTATNSVPDVDETNANFYEVVEEIGGRLNEHNFEAGTFSIYAALDSDAGFVFHAKDMGAGRIVPGPAIGGDDTRIPARSGWRKLEDASISFTSPATLLWINASLQVTQNPTTMPAGTAWANDDAFNYVMVGIEVDGYVIPESVIGGAEPDNDRAYGVIWPTMPLATDIVFPIGPGEHTVSLVVRVGAREGGKGVHVGKCEIICLEMRR